MRKLWPKLRQWLEEMTSMKSKEKNDSGVSHPNQTGLLPIEQCAAGRGFGRRRDRERMRGGRRRAGRGSSGLVCPRTATRRRGHGGGIEFRASRRRALDGFEPRRKGMEFRFGRALQGRRAPR